MEDHPLCELHHNFLNVLLWWPGKLHQVVHIFECQSVFLFLHTVVAFCPVSHGVIPHIRDSCQGVGCEGDDVICKPFDNEVYLPCHGGRELGCGLSVCGVVAP